MSHPGWVIRKIDENKGKSIAFPYDRNFVKLTVSDKTVSVSGKSFSLKGDQNVGNLDVSRYDREVTELAVFISYTVLCTLYDLLTRNDLSTSWTTRKS